MAELGNKKDQGSEDGGLVYVDFQAGMFEALKLNFLKLDVNDFEVVPIAQPKVELYDQTEERICLDLSMKVKDFDHFIKIKVHNTKCSLDVQGFYGQYEKRYEHLDNRTVGEYFSQEVISALVQKINNEVDVNRLNNHIKNLATEGKKVTRSKSNQSASACKVCESGL